MEFQSINPYTGKTVGTHTALTSAELDQKLDLSAKAFKSWRQSSIRNLTFRRKLSKAGAKNRLPTGPV
ncbi:MAG: hypothetical protein LC670_13605 [Flavobacteriales bacterium]|nr:hypothetical protein [Flavobacteriales bacterium]